ncbi:MAG: pantetheine-phosphate adenylyltransferase [candidate division Zixibacteria bacterium]|nr:pantetheine-phosphate adenylyltransferase [candidate division Zixibacteria bacterium]MDH3936837.1 pantetheine-phosphate adenylyltransferase [candidate division Zixibacteria bacterium]MDH4033348.1 pantetheine-phosphate adenylyltransferase [candidate division Zixibacteria bacterium]
MTKETDHTKLAIYPGSFDPITFGHLSLVERAAGLFDRLVVAVAASAGKEPFFDHQTRIRLVEQAIADQPYAAVVNVIGFDGLLADLAFRMKAAAIVRGLRAVSDFENEFQMALMNRKLARSVETVFLMPALSWVYLSSTMVKDVAVHGGDVGELVPPTTNQEILKKFPKAKA